MEEETLFQMSEPRIYRLENTGISPIRSCLKASNDSTESTKDGDSYTSQVNTYIHTYLFIYPISSPSFEAGSVPESMHDWRYDPCLEPNIST